MSELSISTLMLEAPFTTILAFVASVDQDQAAQNVQPDLRSTLSTLGKHSIKKATVIG